MLSYCEMFTSISKQVSYWRYPDLTGRIPSHQARRSEPDWNQILNICRGNNFFLDFFLYEIAFKKYCVPLHLLIFATAGLESIIAVLEVGGRGYPIPLNKERMGWWEGGSSKAIKSLFVFSD